MEHFKLKVKFPGGSSTISNLSAESTLEELKEEISKPTGFEKNKIKILIGYPPKPLNLKKKEFLKLKELNIMSGDTLIVEPDTSMVPVRRVKPIKKENLSECPLSNQHQVFSVQEEICLICEDVVMKRYEVPSDNSCLFTSVYFITNRGEINKERSNDLRKVIAEAIEKDDYKYNATYLGKTNAEYCQWIVDPNSWGGAIELAIFSDYFKIEITCLDIMSGATLRFGQDKYSLRGLLLYDGIHYDPLVMECSHLRRTIFPTTEQRFINLAKEIVHEAQSKRQYTDFNSFIIKCKVCGQNFKGQYEMVIHSQETSHNSYDVEK